MDNNRPWKVIEDGCCIKDCKTRSAAIKAAKVAFQASVKFVL